MFETGTFAQTAPTAQERRSETRWPSGEPGVVTILASESSFDARLVDVSIAGLRLRMEHALDLKEGVRIVYRARELYGEVRWCRQLNDTEFDVGILVQVILGN